MHKAFNIQPFLIIFIFILNLSQYLLKNLQDAFYINKNAKA